MHTFTHTTSPHGTAAPPAAVFSIDGDEALARLLAMFLQNRITGAATSAVMQGLGWPQELLDELAAMPVQDLARVLCGSGGCLGLTLDRRKAAAVLRGYSALRREQQQLDYYLVHGASPALLKQAFPACSQRRQIQRRRELGIELRGGRPPSLDEHTAAAAWRHWQQLGQRCDDLRERYIELHRAFPAHSMASLFAGLSAS